MEVILHSGAEGCGVVEQVGLLADGTSSKGRKHGAPDR